MPEVLACAARFARDKLHESGCGEVGEEDMQAVAVYLALMDQARETR
jgi:hypothetical protein